MAYIKQHGQTIYPPRLGIRGQGKNQMKTIELANATTAMIAAAQAAVGSEFTVQAGEYDQIVEETNDYDAISAFRAAQAAADEINPMRVGG